MSRRPADPYARERALDVLSLARRQGISLSRAARLTGTTRRTVIRHAGAGFAHEGRRWVPKAYDRIPREMTVLTPVGPIAQVVRDSRTASLLSEHANAVHYYLDTGDTSRLEALPRHEFRLHGLRIPLVVDADVIDRLAAGSELHVELYAR
jgi:hypothetical protein